MQYRAPLAFFALALALLAPARAAAQSIPMEVGAPRVEVPAGRTRRAEGPVRVRFEEGEHAGGQALLWGPGDMPATCALPCSLSLEPGQHGITVAREGDTYSAGFVLERGSGNLRVALRAPRPARFAGGATLITFGALTGGVGLGFLLTGAVVASASYYSSTGAVFALAIGLPLLVVGVPLFAGGIVMVNTSSAAATVQSNASLNAWLDRPSLVALLPPAGAFSAPLYALRF